MSDDTSRFTDAGTYHGIMAPDGSVRWMVGQGLEKAVAEIVNHEPPATRGTCLITHVDADAKTIYLSPARTTYPGSLKK